MSSGRGSARSAWARVRVRSTARSRRVRNSSRVSIFILPPLPLRPYRLQLTQPPRAVLLGAADQRGVEATAAALMGAGGVGIEVAEDAVPGVEPRVDARDTLAARGGEQQHLRAGQQRLRRLRGRGQTAGGEGA